jgi:hypothetical protein
MGDELPAVVEEIRSHADVRARPAIIPSSEAFIFVGLVANFGHRLCIHCRPLRSAPSADLTLVN